MRPPLTPPQHRTWTLSDGYTLHGRVWTAPTPAGPPVLYLHGIQSHGGWFEGSASWLADAGRTVVLPDRRGSGLNAEPRGDVPHRRRWLDDLDALWGEIAHEQDDTCDVVGVSWGGKLAVAWAQARPQRVRRLLLIAPGLFPAVDVGLTERFRIGLALVRNPAARHPIPLDDPGLFTQNRDGKDFISNDTLKLTSATARFLYQSARLDHDLRKLPSGALQAQVTLLLAGRERIIRNQPTRDWLTRICTAAPEIHLLSDASHTFEFESDISSFETALRAWARR
jgi:alpha-beta hydrolase superfamily lysophospholipase